MKTITEPQRETPVILETDVIIAGAGPTGFVAALAAARNGAKVVMVDRANYVGGLLTALPMNAFCTYDGTQVIRGIPEEFVQRLIKAGACHGHTKDKRLGSSTATDPELLKVVTQEMVEAAGVQLLFHTQVVAPVMEADTICGIIVENKSGRQAILGKIVIDATGDGDVAASAGVPFEIKERRKIQPGTLMFRMDNVNVDKIRLAVARDPEKGRTIKGEGPGADFFLNAREFILDGFMEEVAEGRKNGDLPPDYPMNWVIIITQPRPDEVFINMAMSVFFHSVDAFDLTKAELDGRRRISVVVNFLKKYIPGFENAYLTSSHHIIGVRESRRFFGEYMLSRDDVLENKTFEDGIMVTPWRPSTGHNPDGKLTDKRWPAEGITGCEVPYRCLLPQKIENLLLSGRSISTDGEAQNAIRNMPPCMATGQAAGTAAALALRHKITPRKVDAQELRKLLVKQGVHMKSLK